MTEFCCVMMKDRTTVSCDQHVSAFDCPDTVIVRTSSGGFGIVIHDGGSSYYKIAFCPWCGTKLSDGETPRQMSS